MVLIWLKLDRRSHLEHGSALSTADKMQQKV
jgi:hypothetical protein